MVLSRSLLLAVALPSAMGFVAPSMPLSSGRSAAPALRSGSTRIKMAALDPQVIQGGVGFIGGIGAAIGIMYTIESQGVKSADKMDDILKTKLNAKVDGGEAENLFSGTDQTIDKLIANMEVAQGGEPAKAKQEPKKKVVVDDDDGW